MGRRRKYLPPLGGETGPINEESPAEEAGDLHESDEAEVENEQDSEAQVFPHAYSIENVSPIDLAFPHSGVEPIAARTSVVVTLKSAEALRRLIGDAEQIALLMNLSVAIVVTPVKQ